MVGLTDLKGLFQPNQFYDSNDRLTVLLCLQAVDHVAAV